MEGQKRKDREGFGGKGRAKIGKEREAKKGENKKYCHWLLSHTWVSASNYTIDGSGGDGHSEMNSGLRKTQLFIFRLSCNVSVFSRYSQNWMLQHMKRN